MKAWISILKSIYSTDERIPLDAEQLVLGRSKLCDFNFGRMEEYVSRIHAIVTFNQESHSYYLRNLSDTNATILNGSPIEQSALLSDGDLIRLSKKGPVLMFESIKTYL